MIPTPDFSSRIKKPTPFVLRNPTPTSPKTSDSLRLRLRKPGSNDPVMSSSPAFTVWHSTAKRAAVKFVKTWMSDHVSESRDPSYVGSAIGPKFPGKDFRGKPRWLHTRESHQEVVLGPNGVNISPTLLGPVWASPPRAAGPVTLPWGKVGVVAWWFVTYNVEVVIAIGEWTWSNGESLLLLCQESSVRLSYWFAQATHIVAATAWKMNTWGSIRDKLIFHVMQAFGFVFMAKRAVCLLQNVFGNCILCTGLCGNFHLAIISHT